MPALDVDHDDFARVFIAAYGTTTRALVDLDAQLDALENMRRLARLQRMGFALLGQLETELGIAGHHLLKRGSESEYAQSILAVCRSHDVVRTGALLKIIDAFLDRHPNTPEELLRRYLTWIIKELDYAWLLPDAGHDHALTEVHVRLVNRELDPRRGHARKVSEKGIEREEEPDRSLAGIVNTDTHGRWTLQGDPGSGKSTQLRYLAIERAKATLEILDRGEQPGPASIPQIVGLAAYVETLRPRRTSRQAARRATPSDFIAAEVAKTYGYKGVDTEELAALLEQTAYDGRGLLLLDGLDEVRPKRRASVLKAVEGWGRHFEGPIIVTSRRFGYARPRTGGFTELEIAPLDIVRQRRLLKKRVREATAEHVLAQVSTPGPLQDMARNAFVLTLMGFWASEREAAGESLVLPSRRVLLYRDVVGRFVRGCAREGAQRLVKEVDPAKPEAEHQALHSVMSELCLRMLQEHAGPWTGEELRGFLAPYSQRAAFRGALKRHRWRPRGRHGPAQADEGGRGALGLPPPHISRVPGRRSAASPGATRRAVAGAARGRTLFGLVQTGDDETGRWAEVFTHLAGLSDDPVVYLKGIRRANRELFLRALTNVPEVPPDVLIAEFGVQGGLELVRELMARVEAPDVLVAKLVELSRRTDDRETRVCLAAALLGADTELAKVCVGAGGARALGLGERAWVEVPAGTFTMGDEASGPPHSVTLTNRFELLATPVTQALYAVVTGTNPSHFTGDLRRPVEQVNWSEAQAFCEAWSKLQQRDIELPTEAEWEYACRAGSQTRFCFGDDEARLGEYAWYGAYAGGETHPVAEKRANTWGLHDMHGNVWEWCHDGQRRYEATAEQDPVGPINEDVGRVVRGGSSWDGSGFVRSAFRDRNGVEDRGWGIGFRCVRRPRRQR